MAPPLHGTVRLGLVIASVLVGAALTLVGCAEATTAAPDSRSAPGRLSLWKIQFESHGTDDMRAILEWAGGDGATSFQYRCDDGPWLPAGDADAIETTVKGDFVPAAEHCFTMQAINERGIAVSNELCRRTPTIPAPTNLRVSRSGIRLTATWDPVDGAASYSGEVEFYADGGWYEWGFGLTNRFGGKETSFSWDNHPTLNADAYSFRVHVQAKNPEAYPSRSAYSPWTYNWLSDHR